MFGSCDLITFQLFVCLDLVIELLDKLQACLSLELQPELRSLHHHVRVEVLSVRSPRDARLSVRAAPRVRQWELADRWTHCYNHETRRGSEWELADRWTHCYNHETR